MKKRSQAKKCMCIVNIKLMSKNISLQMISLKLFCSTTSNGRLLHKKMEPVGQQSNTKIKLHLSISVFFGQYILKSTENHQVLFFSFITFALFSSWSECSVHPLPEAAAPSHQSPPNDLHHSVFTSRIDRDLQEKSQFIRC